MSGLEFNAENAAVLFMAAADSKTPLFHPRSARYESAQVSLTASEIACCERKLIEALSALELAPNCYNFLDYIHSSRVSDSERRLILAGLHRLEKLFRYES